MRCYICDYDQKMGNSDYVDTDCASDPGEQVKMREHPASNNLLNKSRFKPYGGGVVTPDKDNKFICSTCRGASYEALSEMEFMDYGVDLETENEYILGEKKDDRDKAA